MCKGLTRKKAERGVDTDQADEWMWVAEADLLM